MTIKLQRRDYYLEGNREQVFHGFSCGDKRAIFGLRSAYEILSESADKLSYDEDAHTIKCEIGGVEYAFEGFEFFTDDGMLFVYVLEFGDFPAINPLNEERYVEFAKALYRCRTAEEVLTLESLFFRNDDPWDKLKRETERIYDEYGITPEQ